MKIIKLKNINGIYKNSVNDNIGFYLWCNVQDKTWFQIKQRIRPIINEIQGEILVQIKRHERN